MTTTMNKTNHGILQHFFMGISGRDDCYQTAKNYTDNFEQNSLNGYGLYINGADKKSRLRLAATVQKELAIQGRSILKKTVEEFFCEIKRDCKKDNGLGIFTTSREVEALVIHDLGSRPYSHEEMQMLFDLICDRYENMKPTIITTHCGRGNLATSMTLQSEDSTMSEAIANRLAGTTIYLNI